MRMTLKKEEKENRKIEVKSFILHEIGVFLIGQINPISSLFFLENKAILETTKEHGFVLSPINPLQAAALPSHLSNLHSTSQRFCTPIKLRKADAH